MGHARWTGVTLKIVLDEAGSRRQAYRFNGMDQPRWRMDLTS
jgi:hypothetical protein